MRARNIKPGFFVDCELSDVDFATRLLFIGLWCYADREGRFEWKPKQIKATIFPYDKVDIEKLLGNLMSLHVITSNNGIGYVVNFGKHQHPHPHEAKSVLPENINKINVIACHDNGMPFQSDIRIEDTMIKDTMIDDIRIKDTKSKTLRIKPPSQLPQAEMLEICVAWKAFVDMRKAIGKPMTKYAMELRVKDLFRLQEQGNDPVAVLNKSIAGNYQDLYEIKEKPNGTTHLGISKADQVRAANYQAAREFVDSGE